MAADDKIEATIKEIAAKHGIAVSRDDPILILQTINDRLMQDAAQSQQVILDSFKEELEAIANRWGMDAKDKAEKVLNAALSASKDAMAKGMQEGGRAAVEVVRREVESAGTNLAAAIRQARRLMWANLIASGLVAFSAGLIVWTLVLRH